MRKLGIDYGTKKIGIAMTDPGGQMAFPHTVLPNNKQFFDQLIDIIDNHQIKEIIIGQSLDKNNVPNSVQSAIDTLVLDLTLTTGLPVHLVPEQFSTKAAERLQGKHAKIDASAAALILESYLMQHKY
jgi:putative Holliday junction resolvase